MGRINSRTKGASGEREFASWLQRVLSLTETPLRNLEQVRSGGADIVDVPPFIFEVKRCEQLDLRKWWMQVTKAQGQDHHLERVVVFRQNRKPWKGLISANHIGLETGFVEIQEYELEKWIQRAFALASSDDPRQSIMFL